MSPRGTNHRPFPMGFIHTALLSALLIGFSSASYMASHLGFDLPISSIWPAIVQVHGHTQLAGWLGLFIMGVSLHVLPRLSGVPLAFPGAVHVVWIAMAGSLTWRAVAQPLLMAGIGGPFPVVGMLMAGLAQMVAVLIYVGLLLASLRASQIDATSHPKIGPLRPLFLLSLTSWLLFGLTMGSSTISAGLDEAGLLRLDRHLWAADLFVAGVLIPIAFAFSLRLFPLYLRIEPATWNPMGFTAAYTLTTIIEFGARGPWASWLGALSLDVGAAASLLRSLLLLLFIAGLGLHRHRTPLGKWNPEEHGDDRYGRTRPLVLAAYGFLGIGALLQAAAAGASLVGAEAWLQPAGARHAFVAGFGTLLILGIAPRMVAGFLMVRGPAWPRLAAATLWLAAPGAAIATVHLSIPATVSWPARGVLFGLAGPLLWVAVMVLAFNLWTTALRSSE